MIWRKNISVLYIDGSAGLAVGLALFAFAGWVSELYQLPLNTILFLASANTIYGCYALALALSNKKSLMSIKVLAIANSVWVVVCAAIVILYAHIASPVGVFFICGEALFVGLLAVYEWKNRFLLSKEDR
ncbi:MULTISPECIES: hypothetical protein [Alteromonas]|jgi:uncharacterized membrane protein YozB (DUF420 family)|uniref:Transporter n=1 Tax=Alteromonas stellipolaris TaxID=233316 RepID=A0AAW7YZK9_9ALTE|nr:MULTISPECIES: hypothetical protein [Alteromonas]AMJ91467.1 hypothetical protein AV940_13855 [Alteromonas sp. Mac2]ALM89719.1 hypothetical protein AOR13_667 [Alteromonas stellipolaris LMG 21856]AMJ75198.1 hypothetical protein AVL57_15250 [Alteromonas stellipolaris]AMJ87604.1 hypothetical protein AV939_14115 [Alteromonas sp. Mac1]MDO6577894.1 hypothetical protein [Alteromonas stellipolaris]